MSRRAFAQYEPAHARPDPATRMRNLLHSSLHFRRWLESRALDAVVGRVCRGFECPLASYLSERMGMPISVAEGFAFAGEGMRHASRLPSWAEAFYRRADRSERVGHPITAGRCLAILAEDA